MSVVIKLQDLNIKLNDSSSTFASIIGKDHQRHDVYADLGRRVSAV